MNEVGIETLTNELYGIAHRNRDNDLYRFWENRPAHDDVRFELIQNHSAGSIRKQIHTAAVKAGSRWKARKAGFMWRLSNYNKALEIFAQDIAVR